MQVYIHMYMYKCAVSVITNLSVVPMVTHTFGYMGT